MKVAVGKLGLDTHSHGLQGIAYAVERAGHKVVYLGRANDEGTIAKAAIEEDVDAIFLNFYHLDYFGWLRDVNRELEEAGRLDIDIVIGGIIPEEDIPALEEHGFIVYSREGEPVMDFIENIAKKYDQE